jgi:hypothetical protein
MKKSELRQLIREELRNSSPLTYEFSEYDTTPDDSFKREVIESLQNQFPTIDLKILTDLINEADEWHSEDARRDNKRGREYSLNPVSTEDYIAELSEIIEDQYVY